jgi:hypothetical protein
MKVIGAGFGRTGTTSTKVALQQLGFGPCLHMIDLLAANQDLAQLFYDAYTTGKNVDWVEVLQGWESAVDWPACTFYREFMEAFPDAPVVLNVRDPEPWYTSMANTIYQAAMNTAKDPNMADRPAAKMIRSVVWEGDMQGQFLDKERAIQLFHEHNAEVQRFVPRDRLLVFDVKDGWDPLCSFLGVPVPDAPFPHANDTESFKQMMASGAATSGVRAQELNTANT